MSMSAPIRHMRKHATRSPVCTSPTRMCRHCASYGSVSGPGVLNARVRRSIAAARSDGVCATQAAKLPRSNRTEAVPNIPVNAPPAKRFPAPSPFAQYDANMPDPGPRRRLIRSVEEVARIEIAQVAEKLAQEALIRNGTVRDPLRQPHRAPVLQTVALHVLHDPRLRKADRNQLAFHDAGRLD